MRLNAPTFVVFLVSLALAGLAIVTYLGLAPSVPVVMDGQAFWLAIGGWGLLTLGNLVRGL